MIVLIGGVPCSGKSTLVRDIFGELGTPEYVEPMKGFPCEKRGDVLILGRYPEGEIFGGTDRIGMNVIPLFRDFINQEALKHKHILIEGDRFFRSVDIEWLLKTHDATAYILTVNGVVEKKRHIKRNDTQSEKWLKSRRTQIGNIMMNNFHFDVCVDGDGLTISPHASNHSLLVRTNETDTQSSDIKNEIMEFLSAGTVSASNDNVEPSNLEAA